MDWSFYDNTYVNVLGTEDSGNFFHIIGGGDLYAVHCFMPNACTMLLLDAAISASGSNNGFGPNNALYKFEQVKLDSQAFNSTGFFRLLNHLDTAYEGTVESTVIVNGLQLPTTATYGTGSGSGKRLAVQRGLNSLTIRDSRLMGALDEAFEWHTSTGTEAFLTLDNCVISGMTTNTDCLAGTSSTGDLYFTMKNCRDASGNPIADHTTAAITGTG